MVQVLTQIQWLDHLGYEAALIEAAKSGKPILLDLHAPSCAGCSALEANVYTDEEVAQAVNASTIPLRVVTDTDGPDPIVSDIVGKHIFIWSPTVQLLSPMGTIYHEFLGSPRHTRLDMGYSRVHHELSGDLTPEKFMAQLWIGQGKSLLQGGDSESAVRRFEAVTERFPGDEVAAKEAQYWISVARGNGKSGSKQRPPTVTMPSLARAVELFAQTLIRVPDAELMKDWHGSAGPGSWAKYTDCLREVAYGVYQTLIDFANDVHAARAVRGPIVTLAHRILSQHQQAYRGLQATLFGVPDEYLDMMPFEKERTLRNNLVHCAMAEFWAHSPQIRHGLKRHRDGLEPAPLASASTLSEFGPPPDSYGPLSDLLIRYETLHRTLIEEFSDTTDEELEALTIWWEDKPVEVRFRLNRLGWHLRDHSEVIERLLDGIGHKRSATERLARQLFDALGQAEGALIGAGNEFDEEFTALTDFINFRAAEVSGLLEANSAHAAAGLAS